MTCQAPLHVGGQARRGYEDQAARESVAGMMGVQQAHQSLFQDDRVRMREDPQKGLSNVNGARNAPARPVSNDRGSRSMTPEDLRYRNFSWWCEDCCSEADRSSQTVDRRGYWPTESTPRPG